MGPYPMTDDVIRLFDEQATETARLLREHLADPDEFANILWNEFAALISKYERLPKES